MLLIGVCLLGFGVLSLYLKVNVMSSLPYGAFWLSAPPARLTPGMIVSVQTPETLALMRRTHGSLVAAWPILKPVAAVAGEAICRRADRLQIRGEDWGHIYATTMDGQPLPQWLTSGECRLVPAEAVFLASQTDGSLDSRYLGPIAISAIRAQAIPLWTW